MSTRLQSVILPFLIALLTTLLTVGTLSLLLQASTRQVLRAKVVYLPYTVSI